MDRMEPSLVSRIYNGVDQRKGYPIIITKPIVPVEAKPVARKAWWRRLWPFA